MRQAAQKSEAILAELEDMERSAELPDGTEYIVGIFGELSATRRQGFSGPEPISNLEIAAWAGLFGIRLDPWEVAAIHDLDRAYMDFCAGLTNGDN